MPLAEHIGGGRLCPEAMRVLRHSHDYSTIDEFEPLATALMPEPILRDLTPQQAADLLAYLESLR